MAGRRSDIDVRCVNLRATQVLKCIMGSALRRSRRRRRCRSRPIDLRDLSNPAAGQSVVRVRGNDLHEGELGRRRQLPVDDRSMRSEHVARL